MREDDTINAWADFKFYLQSDVRFSQDDINEIIGSVERVMRRAVRGVPKKEEGIFTV